MMLSPHLPPVARPWTSAEMDAAARFARRFGSRWLVTLLFAPGVVPEQAGQLAELQERTGCEVLARCYDHQPILRYSGSDWGYRAAEMVAPVRHLVSVATLDNEPNHADDGGVTDPGRIAAFWVDSASGIRDALGASCPRLAVPPLSPGIEGYRELYKEIAWRVGYVHEDCAAHVYARTGNYGDVAWLEGLFRARVLVTEFDSWTAGGYLPIGDCLARMPGAVAVCWFALSGDDPQFQQFYWLPNEAAILAGEGIVFTEATETIESQQKEIELLKTQQGLTLDLIERILLGKWDAASYGAEAADALLQSFNPKYQDVRAVRFPNP